jgi:DNA invertase Pin-like site-specific DNA recombinase
VHKIFTEQMSGAVIDRPASHDALEFARRRHAHRVEAQPRGAVDEAVAQTIETLRARGIGFRSLTEALDTTIAQGRLVFHMFGALAELESSLIRERTQAGLAAARRAGRTGGRPAKPTDEDIEAAKATLANPDIGVTQLHTASECPRHPVSVHPGRTNCGYPRRLRTAALPGQHGAGFAVPPSTCNALTFTEEARRRSIYWLASWLAQKSHL